MKVLLRLLFGSPQALLVSGFAALILVGTASLLLPIARVGDAVGPLEALFTATSAVCVTGLVVVDTATDFTPFGQLVILVLIQLGGLGLVTVAAIGAQFAARRLSFRSQETLGEVFFQRNLAGELSLSLRRIVGLSLVLEGIGAVLLFPCLLRYHRPLEAAGSAVFHAVSAFCNAGFSLASDNLLGYGRDVPLLATITGLIVLGGIGHAVLLEGWMHLPGGTGSGHGPLGRYSFHSKVAVLVSGLLIAFGCLALLLCGISPDLTDPLDRFCQALFQSVTARTAGFNTVEIGHLPLASLLVLIMLMLVGGSPGSCAGGLKTTTLAILGAQLHSILLGRKDTVLLGRTISVEVVRRITLLLSLAGLWNACGVLVLALSERSPGIGLEDLVFEQISAFGTVGLSTGLTPKLSTVGRLWIVATMFVGRLGPLTLAMWMLPRFKERITFPEGRLMIG